MLKRISTILIALALLISFAPVAQGARTDSIWDRIGNYIKTNCPTGCNILINGSNKYLNWGSASGSTGYGVRDNSGTLEVKHSGGSWATISAGGEANTGSSLGTGINIFDSKSGSDLRFNTLSAGTDITISTTTDPNTLKISSTGSGDPFAWSILETYGEDTSATTSSMWFQGNVYASSTSYLTNMFAVNATTTNMEVSGLLTVNGGEGTHIVNGTPFMSVAEIHSEGVNNPMGLSVHNHGDTNAIGAQFTTLRSKGTHDSEAVVADNSVLGRWFGFGYDGNDYNFGAGIEMRVDGTPGANDMPTELVLSTTADGASTLTEHVFLKPNGNFGIGTSSPYAKLSVVGEIVASWFTATSLTESTFAGGINTTAYTGADTIKDTAIDWGTGANQVSAIDVPILDTNSNFTGTEVETALNEVVPKNVWKQNGLPNHTDTTIAFNDGTRRFTINPTGASFDYYVQGVKYTISSSDVLNVNYVDIADTEGAWHFYYDGSTLTAEFNPTHDDVRDIMENHASVAIVFWDADNSQGQLIEERHGLQMSPPTHINMHETSGARYDDGLALSDFIVDDDGSIDLHAQFGNEAGEILDEDIEHDINAVASTTGLQIWHRDTSGWNFTTNAGFSMLTAGSGRLAYDNSGTLTEVTNGDFVLCHVFATSMVHNNLVAIVGQTEYATKALAQAGATTEITSILSIANLSPELKPIATVIYQTKNTFSNAVKAIIVSTDTGGDYVDFRKSQLNPAFGSAQDHGELAGIQDDDHFQYLLTDGSRVLTGNQSFGGFDIWNIGNATTTNSTTTTMYISQAVNLMGEQFTNFTNYVRSLSTGETGITLSSGDISFDCSEVEGTGINCAGEAITLDNTGAWGGTLTSFGSDFFAYFSATNTDALSEGSTNFYATQSRWDSFWNASTTLDSVTSIPNLDTTGVLNSGSITSGFGNIDIGASVFTTTGDANFGTLTVTGQTTLANASTTQLTVSGNTWLSPSGVDNVGVGTTSPMSLFSVHGTSTAITFKLGNGYCMFEDSGTTTPNLTMGLCPE